MVFWVPRKRQVGQDLSGLLVGPAFLQQLAGMSRVPTVFVGLQQRQFLAAHFGQVDGRRFGAAIADFVNAAVGPVPYLGIAGVASLLVVPVD